MGAAACERARRIGRGLGAAAMAVAAIAATVYVMRSRERGIAVTPPTAPVDGSVERQPVGGSANARGAIVASEAAAEVDLGAQAAASDAAAGDDDLDLLPPGVLEILVLRGAAPIGGASIRVRASSHGELPEEWSEPAEGMRRAETDAAGLARFEDLAGHEEYAIGVRTPEGVELRRSERLWPDTPTQRVVVLLGSGGIAGTAWKDDGTPRVGATIDVRLAARGATDYWRTATTDANGAYRIGDLPAGEGNVIESPGDYSEQRRAYVHLAEGEWKKVDFGTAELEVRWRGRLLSRSGAVLPAPAKIHLHEVEHGNQYDLDCDPDAPFEIDLPPGKYTANLWTMRRAIVLATVELSSGVLERDLVVDARCIVGRLMYVGAWHDPALPARTAQVWLRRMPDRKPQWLANSRIENAYAFFDVDPGEYEITTHPQAIASGAPVPVTLGEAQDFVVVDLTITDP